MKTLVCIFSHLRTFSRCLPTQYHHVYRHLPEPHFVVYTVNDKDAQSAFELEKYFPKDRIHVTTIEAQPELPIPCKPACDDWTLGRMYHHEPYAISVHPQAILRQLWQLERGWEWASRTVKVEEFSLFVRMRPDSWFRDVRMPALEHYSLVPVYGNAPIPAMKGIPAFQAHTPWWGRFGGVNDRFAIMGAKAADAYFTTYGRTPDLIKAGCPLHPESLIRFSLEQAGCMINDRMWAMFSKLYAPDHPDRKIAGTFRDPELLPEDIAHYAGGGR